MDIRITLGEKVVHADANHLYQTDDIGIEFIEKDVPMDMVRERTLALRLQAKKYVINTKLLEGLITQEQGVLELKKYQDSVNGK